MTLALALALAPALTTSPSPYLNQVDPAQLRVPVFVWACPEDPAADYRATEAWCRSVPVCCLEAVTDTAEKHCITGDIQNPSSVEHIVRRALSLTRGVLGEARGEARG